jgi:ribosome-associated protein
VPKKKTARSTAVAMARVCAENRCRDVTVLDLRGLSPVTDFFVLATGTSTRQMQAVAYRVEEAGEEMGQKLFGSEGDQSSATAEPSKWVLIDYVDVVVHVFTEDSRKYYDIELLWGDAPRVNWQRGWKPRAVGDEPSILGKLPEPESEDE